jgi:hypothetical protein
MIGPERHAEVAALRALWRAVLIDQLRVMLSGSPAPLVHRVGDVREAESWFGGRDFRLVCVMGGLDPDYVARKVKALEALPPAQRDGMLDGHSRRRMRIVSREVS